MVRTYEDAKSRKRQEDEEREMEGRSEFDFETSTEFTGESLLERFRDLRNLIRAPELGDIGEISPPQDPNDPIGPLPPIDWEELTDSEIFSVIAETLVESFEVLADMNQELSPFSQITVSGATAIDDAAESKPVAPSVPTRYVLLRASPENRDILYIGDSQVQPQTGIPLRPGESFNMKINFARQRFHMASETEDEVIQVLGVV